MRTNTILWTSLVLALGVVAFGCDDGETPADSGMEDPDTGMDMPDSDTGSTPTCETYCDTVQMTCTGDNEIYADRDECIDVCTSAGWEAGDEVTTSGPASGNTIGCRTYHGGAPAGDDPVMHCPHAGETGANVCGDWCEVYCGTVMNVCTGGDAQYGDMAECMTACAALDDTGEIGVTEGDTVQCRLYHLGVAIRSDDTALHCPHAGASGGGVCTGGWTFRTDDPGDYTRVDRMGMPAVATALISGSAGTTKNQYNDGDPADDAAGTFVPEIVANIDAIHAALDDDLAGLSLVPCSGTAGGSCVSQGAPLIIPDTLTIDPSMAPGFPNGRTLPDPVIDVTLAVVLLDLGVPGQDATTLATMPVNPAANDVEFLDTFPYLAAPHTP